MLGSGSSISLDEVAIVNVAVSMFADQVDPLFVLLCKAKVPVVLLGIGQDEGLLVIFLAR